MRQFCLELQSQNRSPLFCLPHRNMTVRCTCLNVSSSSKCKLCGSNKKSSSKCLSLFLVRLKIHVIRTAIWLNSCNNPLKLFNSLLTCTTNLSNTPSQSKRKQSNSTLSQKLGHKPIRCPQLSKPNTKSQNARDLKNNRLLQHRVTRPR